jgi:hypothetical protein
LEKLIGPRPFDAKTTYESFMDGELDKTTPEVITVDENTSSETISSDSEISTSETADTKDDDNHVLP